MEIRTLGVDVNNGKATVPKSIAEEILVMWNKKIYYVNMGRL